MYHSNYGTFGLISSQECLTHEQKVVLNPELKNYFVKLNPVYVVPQDKVEKALKFLSWDEISPLYNKNCQI